jgi:sporulation related protein
MERGRAVDSQASDRVVHVDGRKTWTDAVLASFRPSDHHVSDDEIFEILYTERDGDTAADLCAAKGVTIPMYCVWKAKYRHLSLDELRKMRRREVWRARCLLTVLLTAAVLGAGGIVFALGRAAYATITVTTGVTPANLPSTPMNRESLSSGNLAFAPPSPAPLVEHRSRPDAPSSIIEPGYKIQVAAAQNLQEGRVFLERLAAAGYPAYLSRAIVSDIEMFRVRVGPFDTLSLARQIALQLQRDGYNGAWIAR